MWICIRINIIKVKFLSLTLFYCALANEPSCIENGRDIKSLVTLK